MRTLFASLFAAAALGGGTWVWGQEGDLFEKLDANKDGFVTADEVEGEEQKAKIEQVLRKGDKDGDKKLTKEEFRAALKPAGEERAAEGAKDQPRPRREGVERDRPRPDAGYLEEMFKKWDANSDGKLTEEEVPENARTRFKQFLERNDDDGDKALSKEQAPRFIMMAMQPGLPEGGFRPDLQMAEQRFREWDANKDGKLTADEVPANLRERFTQILGRIDSEDKSITKEQFGRVAMGLLVPGGPPGFGPGGMPMPMAVLRVLDGDNDGELSKEEIEGAAKSLAKLDKNEDGKLTRDELMPGFAGGGFPGGPPLPGRPGEGRPDQRRPEGRPEGRPDARPGERRPGEGRPGANAEQIRARIKEMDKDRDGKISKEEAQDRIKENFDAIDANSDGSIDEAEIRARFQRGRPDGDRPEGRRRDGDRPAGRRPPAEGDEKAKERE